MIEVKNVTMRFGKTTALEGISFTSEKGKVLGLVGPNGAGKTTIMRIITSYLYPASGTVVVNGHDVTREPLVVRGSTGYMPETVPLYDDMVVDEYIYFIGRARGLSGGKLEERVKWVRDNCGLVPVWKHTISEISKGYRQRAGLAQALIHDPDILILDEPMTGLDPLQIIGIRKLVRDLAKDKTIIFSTHIFQEVEALADRIVILNNGRVIADGLPDDITRMATRGETVTLVVKAKEEDVMKILRDEPVIDDAKFGGIEPGGYSKYFIGASAGKPLIPRLNELIGAHGWVLREMRREHATLEEAFIRLLSKDSGKKGF